VAGPLAAVDGAGFASAKHRGAIPVLCEDESMRPQGEDACFRCMAREWRLAASGWSGASFRAAKT